MRCVRRLVWSLTTIDNITNKIDEQYNIIECYVIAMVNSMEDEHITMEAMLLMLIPTWFLPRNG